MLLGLLEGLYSFLKLLYQFVFAFELLLHHLFIVLHGVDLLCLDFGLKQELLGELLALVALGDSSFHQLDLLEDLSVHGLSLVFGGLQILQLLG